jgi:hypothetical protein
MTYGGAVTLPGLPAGCYWVRLGGIFYYNEHATGASNFYAQPLCAGAADPRAAFMHVGERRCEGLAEVPGESCVQQCMHLTSPSECYRACKRACLSLALWVSVRL